MVQKVVQTENLGKVYKIKGKSGIKQLKALENINLKINGGDFVALLGPNGAGKSTLIKILIGVLAHSSGKVSVLGTDPLNNREKIISRLGVVFGQRSRLWWDLPVKDSFDLTKRLYGDFDKKWETFLIESINIGELLDRQVKKLSLGEKMRCELVNTLLYNPELIFLDEPTIGLDVVSKQRIREALKILHQQGKTILLTSHDTGDIEKLCQRVVVINRGKLVVDLPMGKFVELNNEIEIGIKTKEKLKLTYSTHFTDYKVDISQISDYEFRMMCPKKDLNKIMRLIFDNFEIADIDFESKQIEKILIDLYENK